MPDTTLLQNLLQGPIAARLGQTTILSAELEAEVDQAVFNLRAAQGEIIISINSLADARTLMRNTLVPLFRAKDAWAALESLLGRIDYTIYIRNLHFGIMGPRANPILKKLLHMYVERLSHRVR